MSGCLPRFEHTTGPAGCPGSKVTGAALLDKNPAMTSADAPVLAPSHRAAALLALASVLLAGGWSAVVLIAHLPMTALGLAGFAVAVTGAWRVATGLGARRVAGVVLVVAGLAVVALALWRVLGGVDHVGLQLVAVVGVLGLGSLAGRHAVEPILHAAEPVRVTRVAPPRRPVLLCNPRSGRGTVGRVGLVEAAEAKGISTVVLGDGDDLEALARRAVADGADCLGMAGGDGPQGLVAAVAAESGIPFVCIAAGTRNHFALDLGLDPDDPCAGLAAFTDGVERRIDRGWVNGRSFVNNVSLGAYAEIVADEAYREAKLDTALVKLPELLGATADPFDLHLTTLDGTDIDGAFLVQVSNNPYVLDRLTEVGTRPTLETGVLGVIALTIGTGGEAAALVTRSIAGLAANDPNLHRWTAPRVVVSSGSATVAAGVDGEAVDLTPPIELRIDPLGLRILVPAVSVARVLDRHAKRVHVRDLFELAFKGHVDPEL